MNNCVADNAQKVYWKTIRHKVDVLQKHRFASFIDLDMLVAELNKRLSEEGSPSVTNSEIEDILNGENVEYPNTIMRTEYPCI